MLLSRDGAAAGGPRAVRLGYCLNLHPSETLADVERALEDFVAPLCERLGTGREFGVGMYLGEGPARALASDESALERFAERVRALGADPFTYNAFPQGGFQEDGLKERVYEPDWRTAERLAYTIDVGRVAARLAGGPGRTIAISTHPGAYGAEITDRSGLRACAEGMARAVGEFARIEAEGGPRLVLAVEAEPDASARNSRALAESLMFARLVGTRVLTDEFGHPAEVTAGLMERHLGTCLDCCHSAVEFEEPGLAVELANMGGPLGKIQFSSALRLEAPAAHPAARAALLGLDEPRFLHQVTARAAGEFLHLADLPALREAAADDEGHWARADEWRCHFHVPVDLERAAGLATTRDHADAVLRAALARPSAEELHVEIETYTWNVLPESAGAPTDGAAVIDGLEREYRHVLDLLGAEGWSPGKNAPARV